MAIWRLNAVVCSVEGEDAATWLQGQLTNDVGSLTDGKVLRTLLLSPTGSILTDAFLKRIDGSRFLLVVAESAASVLARRIVMEEVELAVLGPAFHDLDCVDGLLPTQRIAPSGCDRLGPIESGLLLSREQWDRLRIVNGYAEWGVDFGKGAPSIAAESLPQECGLTSLISFTKGCYVGQEPVVMLEHRGQPRRRIFRVRGAGLTVGEMLVDGQGASAGVVTSVSGDEGFATVRSKFATLSLLNGRGPVELVGPVTLPTRN